MTESEFKELSPFDEFLQASREEVEQVRRELKEISLLVEQSQGEVEKLAQRNASITAHLHQMQSHFDTVPREDIQSTYEAFTDAQQRLFTMRGQLEKLQSDEAHLKRFGDHLAKTLNILEGGPKEWTLPASWQGAEIRAETRRPGGLIAGPDLQVEGRTIRFLAPAGLPVRLTRQT